MNYTFQSFNFRGPRQAAAVLRPDRQHRRRGVRPHRAGLLHDQPAADRHDQARQRPRRTRRSSRRGRRAQLLPLHRQRPDGAAGRLDGQPVERQLRLLQRQPQARPAAQLLPGVRRAGEQDPRLRDGRRPDRPRDGRLPAGARRRAHRRLRQGAGEADRASTWASCCRSRTSATRSSPRRKRTRRRACTGSCSGSARTTTREIGKIWNGPHPEDGSALRVEDRSRRARRRPDLPEEPQLSPRRRDRPGDDRGHRQAPVWG